MSVVRFFIGAVRLIQAEKRFFAGGALFRAAAGTAHAGVILLAVLQRLHRMRRVLIAVIAAVFGQIILYDSVAGNLRGACVYSAYEKKAYKVICVQTEEKNLSQSVSYWDFFRGGTRISSCQYKMCFFF